MAAIDFQHQEIRVKLVYWGPALSGKTTNVRSLHGFIPARLTGDLATLDTEDERTIFFDYLPVKAGPIGPYRLLVQVFSVPGQAQYRRTRQLVLQNADGVVFVADSAPQELESNLSALRDLEDSLRSYGIDPEDLPLVFLYNKRDLPGALPIDTLERALNPRDLPSLPGVAIQGNGVIEAFNELMDRVREKIEAQLTRADASRSLERGPAAPRGSSWRHPAAELVARIAEAGEHTPEQLSEGAERLGGSDAPPAPLSVRVDHVERAGARIVLRGVASGAPLTVELQVSDAELRALLPPAPGPRALPDPPASDGVSLIYVGLAVGLVWLALLTMALLLV